MQFTRVLNIVGFLLMFLGGAMLLPLPFSFFYGAGDHIALMVSAAITLFFGFLAYRFARFEGELRIREGFAIVSFSWLFFSAFGSLPYLLSGSIPSITDAFFETMSGFSTTGATILPNVEVLPAGVMFWRSLTHWIGGMGIVVLSLAILPFLGVGGMQLFKAEVPGPVADRLTPRIAGTAKILSGVYILFTAVQTILMMIGGMSFFDSLCHSFGTLATGGYSTRAESIGAYGSAYIEYVVIFFMLIAGTNFSLHYRFLRGDFLVYFRNKEFLFFLSLIGIAFVIIGADTILHRYDSIEGGVRDTLFQVVAIITTTGYSTADYEQWSFSSQFVLFLLMFIGGCAGSTAGGMKMLRVHVLIKFVFSEITRLMQPHAVVPVRVGKQTLDREVVGNVVGFFILFMLIFSGGVLLMSAMGLDMATSFGAVAASLGNIGPGLGNVGPTDHYGDLPAFGKWVLCTLMLLGRLEIYTVIILFSPSYWRK